MPVSYTHLDVYKRQPDVDVVIVPIGGGGLISGVAFAIKDVYKRQTIRGLHIFAADGFMSKKAPLNGIIRGLQNTMILGTT